MARFIQGIFDSDQISAPATSLRINTSLQGTPIALILGGQQRIAGNIIDYYNLDYTNYNGPGGKGGTLASIKGTGNYAYTVTFILGICEGPVANAVGIWVNGAPWGATAGSLQSMTLPQQVDGTNNVDYEIFLGDYEQEPWGYTESDDTSHALGYRGLCYAGFVNYPLGGSTSIPNLNIEPVSTNSYNVVPGQPDGDASIALTAFLTNPYFGLGFPVNRLGSLALWQSYCTALGFAVSPVAADNSPGSRRELCRRTELPCAEATRSFAEPRERRLLFQRTAADGCAGDRHFQWRLRHLCADAKVAQRAAVRCHGSIAHRHHPRHQRLPGCQQARGAEPDKLKR